MAELWQSFMNASDYSVFSPWFPSPLICIRDMVVTGSSEAIKRLPWNGIMDWLDGTWFWISRSNYKDPAAYLFPVIIAISMTLLRIFLNWAIFRRVPKWYKFTAEATEKFPESIWKCLYYTCTWLWGVYILFSSNSNPFFNLRLTWDSWTPHQSVEPALFWLYMTQMGFYLHCCYASIYIETIRKDFHVLMTHHILTLGLLLFSYIVRFHVIGLLLLCILDIGDVFLELSKTVVYFKDRGGEKHPITEILANICFAIFTIQHVLCRLYWYPTKVIYSALHVSVVTFPGGPYYALFNPMLLMLYAMQAYWFKFILRLLWKILILKEDLEDTREFEEEKKEDEKEAKKKEE